MELVKAPVAVTGPSVVLLSAMVGLAEVLQTTPCSVGLNVPRTVILPLPVAVVVVMSVTAWVVTVGAQESGERDILAIDCAGWVGGISADVIQRPRSQASHGAGKGAGRTDRTIRGFAIRDSGIGRGAPDDAMLGGIGHAERGNIAIPCGCCGCNVRDSRGGDGRRVVGSEGDILTIRCACRIGGVCADMIQRPRRQTGHGAGKGADRANRTIRGFAVRRGRVGGCAPDDTMLGRIGHTQRSDVAVPGGCCGCNVGDCLGGDCWRNESRESDILAIDCPNRIGGISADVIQRPRRQIGHGAGKGTGRADRTIRGFVIRDGGSCRCIPNHTMLGGIGLTGRSDITVPCGCCTRNGSHRLSGDDRQ